VIVDAQRGLLLSNHHVIANADEITVTLAGGEQRKAAVVGSDSEADIAVLRIKPDGLSAVVEGDSSTLRVGDFVVAIGNPFGLGQTVTSGIVSAIGRSGLGIAGYEDFIQTDASINPGNSGGALINLRGELVGINTAIVAPAGGNVGIGFAIPVNMARGLMEQIVETGSVRRGQLGIGIQDLTADIASGLGIDAREGALVTQVGPGSPAEKAGLQRADLVVALNGVAIRGAGDLKNRIGLLPVGTEVELEVLREGKRKKIEVEVGERVQQTAKFDRDNPLDPALAGATLQEAGSTPASQGRVGIEIVAVDPGSPAARLGLRPGDIIVQVNLKPVARLEDLRSLVSGEGSRVLTLERGDRALYLALR
jgi:serine protease Do/serine protease DegQ